MRQLKCFSFHALSHLIIEWDNCLALINTFLFSFHLWRQCPIALVWFLCYKNPSNHQKCASGVGTKTWIWIDLTLFVFFFIYLSTFIYYKYIFKLGFKDRISHLLTKIKLNLKHVKIKVHGTTSVPWINLKKAKATL